MVLNHHSIDMSTILYLSRAICSPFDHLDTKSERVESIIFVPFLVILSRGSVVVCPMIDDDKPAFSASSALISSRKPPVSEKRIVSVAPSRLSRVMSSPIFPPTFRTLPLVNYGKLTR